MFFYMKIWYPLTVKKAIVFKAAPAKQSVEWVHGLLSLNRRSFQAVDIGSAFATHHNGIHTLRQLHVPNSKKNNNYQINIQ